MSDKRRKHRQLFDCTLELSWEDAQGSKRVLIVHAIDLSNSGIRVESSEPLPPHTNVFVRAERYGITGSTVVRHCSRRGAKYVVGLEFAAETSTADPEPAEAFIDYYELLQISPNAEPETIHRVFRIMASRYHPDNKETGDSEKFLLLTKAYTTLSDPAKRAAYDQTHRNRHTEPLPVFGLKEFVEGLDGEVNRRLGILSLLYNRRRTNPDDPGISLLEFETVMSFPREHLEFAIWFLREKEYIRTGNHSDYSIAAAGVEYLESELPSNAVLSKLLHAPAGNAPAGPNPATSDPGHALALVRSGMGR
ncbi:MAG TPA: DnaJ domain-containing protein [Bryobacteraceae bacterium]|nr:DnaJ domain-containing protein [Bryobacteraceae bacterium]